MNGKKIEQEADDEQSSESSFKKEFECVPWWQEMGNSTSSSTTLSNYQRLNLFHSLDEQKEFDNILNGALDLMDHSSVQCYKNKLNFLGVNN